MRASLRTAATAGVVMAGILAIALSGCSATPSPDAVGRNTAPPTVIATPTVTPTPTITPTPTVPVFDKTARSVDDPASVWVVVNKSRGLNPAGFVPPDLVYPAVTYVNRQPMRQEAATALVAMLSAARSEANLAFSVQSAYRSYETQTSVYNDDAARNGRAAADTDTARPGHSEHQTGLAIDLSAVPASCSLASCLGETPHGKWLAANAWRFGFLLRYPADKVPITGFTYEPWHFRYIGVPLATEMHRTGITTLEEFFGLPGGTTYPQ